ncbi:DNA translocase FtsK [Erysipelothrix sp. HDW6A]|uniref:DNA translocase FtsK n=1 Tax=Erysipelothrix sp. HDW6A TaxID=2714928 RepID=UPI00140CA869|nr:DNA translocase FtsK [Erysipelothrix sp. HDW6A]QIK57564.1 DNA translocase FtsK [Erysipelothrix sp. HDW6A]
MAKKKRQTKASIQKRKEIIIFGVCIALIGFSLIGWFRLGFIGAVIDNSMRVVIGQYTIPYYILIIVILLLYLIRPDAFERSPIFWIGITLLSMSVILLQSLTFDRSLIGIPLIQMFFKEIPVIFSNPSANAFGGLVGAVLYGLLSFLLDREGVIIFIFVFFLIAMGILITPTKLFEPVSKGAKNSKSWFERHKERREESKSKKELETSVDAMIDSNYEEVRANFVSLDEAEKKETPVVKDTHKDSSLFMTLDDELEVQKEDTAIVEPLSKESEEVKKDDEVVSVPSNAVANYSNYRVPPLTLLESQKGGTRSSANAGSAKAKADRLIAVLKQFGIEATLIDIHIGPAVTKFELKPDSNVKISKISSIQDNLMMELAVKTLRIEAPIPGKSAVGIEIPNVEMIPVKMREVIQQTTNFNDPNNINVALGKDLMGKPIVVSLNKMPHLLVAGATGSGKSVCMNSIITSILLTKKPDELKLLLVDPKKVEFTPYVEIPHLIGPVISDPMQASMALKVIVDEMDLRYETFSKTGVRNIGSYNEKVQQFPQEGLKRMPWIVVIIDELADLMAVAGKEVETSIQRITQLARAAGIHLIVATQRPSVDVVTGIIKANIPSRIAFAVSSSVDSRTILDSTGAEKLLGYGDMLYIPMGEPHPTRVQGVYVSDDEVRRVAQRSSDQAKPTFDDAFIKLDGVDGNHGIVDSMDDPLYEEAKDFVVREQKASTSLLQRRFKVGYNRAANLIDALEQNGVIGPANGSKPRLVFVQAAEEIE